MLLFAYGCATVPTSLLIMARVVGLRMYLLMYVIDVCRDGGMQCVPVEGIAKWRNPSLQRA